MQNGAERTQMADFDLRRLQLAELQILKDVVAMCDENDIVYFLDSGTLLGAVRHKGFIPWDDDVDIIMDDKNYKKFCRIAPQRLPACYFVQNIDSDPKVGISWTKVRQNGTTCMDADSTSYDVHYGIGIDIFVLIGVPKTTIGNKLWKVTKKTQEILLNKFYYQSRGVEVPGRWRFLWAMPEGIRMVLVKTLQKFLMIKCAGHEKVFNMWYQSPEKYSVSFSAYRTENRIKLSFEDTELWCPGEYDEVLRANYGEWWVIPPESERLTHGDIIVDFEKDYKEYYTGE